jgi:hypothetical protein
VNFAIRKTRFCTEAEASSVFGCLPAGFSTGAFFWWEAHPNSSNNSLKKAAKWDILPKHRGKSESDKNAAEEVEEQNAL